MQLHSLSRLCHSLHRHGFHRPVILLHCQGQTADGSGGLVALDGAGRVVNAPQTGKNGFLAGTQFLRRDLSAAAGLQLTQDLRSDHRFFIAVDAGGNRQDTLGAVVAGAATGESTNTVGSGNGPTFAE